MGRPPQLAKKGPAKDYSGPLGLIRVCFGLSIKTTAHERFLRLTLKAFRLALKISLDCARGPGVGMGRVWGVWAL